MGEQESTCISHAPCPRCGSADNLAIYDDGHGWCFTPGCGYRQHGDTKENIKQEEKYSMDFIKGESEPLKKRGLSKATASKWSYQVGEFKGKKVQIANGKVVLLKDAELIDVFINPGEAYRAGLSRYGDGYFSVQPVTDKPIELGHMSFALR